MIKDQETNSRAFCTHLIEFAVVATFQLGKHLARLWQNPSTGFIPEAGIGTSLIVRISKFEVGVPALAFVGNFVLFGTERSRFVEETLKTEQIAETRGFSLVSAKMVQCKTGCESPARNKRVCYIRCYCAVQNHIHAPLVDFGHSGAPFGDVAKMVVEQGQVVGLMARIGIISQEHLIFGHATRDLPSSCLLSTER